MPCRRPRARPLLAPFALAALFALAPSVRTLRAQVTRPIPTRDTTRDPTHDTSAVAPSDVEMGRMIFHGRGTCYGCHGVRLEGTPIAPSLLGPTFRRIDGSYASILRMLLVGSPGTAMVSHPGRISDAQARQVAAYVWAVGRRRAKA